MIRETAFHKRIPYCSYLSSQVNKGTIYRSVEYSDANTWNFNGNNRCLNNNNRYNSNFRSRACLDFKESQSQSTNHYLVPLEELIELEKECYNGKHSAVLFRANYTHNMIELWHNLNNFEITINEVYRFVVTEPKTREIVFCDYKDKLIQSFYVKELREKLETESFPDNSFSCRKGKGVINAVNMFSDLIRLESNNYTEKELYLGTVDLKNFFMTIDVDLAAKLMSDFIEEKFKDYERKDLLLYLTRILYTTSYSEHIIDHTPQHLKDLLPEEKTLAYNQPQRGVPIGNWPSQTIGNFITTFALNYLTSLGVKYVHYTDDTALILPDKQSYNEIVSRLEEKYKNDLNLKLHPHKRYLQHYSKGSPFLGRKVRFDRKLPSNRTYNSVTHKVDVFCNKMNKTDSYSLEKFMQSFNSYMGLLRTMNTFNVRKMLCETVKDSKVGKYYKIDEENYTKIVLKKKYLPQQSYIRWIKQNKKKNKQQ